MAVARISTGTMLEAMQARDEAVTKLYVAERVVQRLINRAETPEGCLVCGATKGHDALCEVAELKALCPQLVAL